MGRFLRVIAVLGVLGVLAIAGVYFYFESAAKRAIAPSDSTPIEFTVTKGASLRTIGRRLFEEGLIENAVVWDVYNRLHPEAGAKAGRHALHRAMTLAEIRLAITQNPLPEDEPLTIVEGSRIRDIDQTLVAAGRIAAGEYASAASSPAQFQIGFPLEQDNLEGYLFPETYMVPKEKLDVPRLIQRQLDAFSQRFYEVHKTEIAGSGRTLAQIVIMASMLEREEPKPELRPQVAGILWKRIDSGWALGVDATSRYTLDDWSDRRKFLKKLRDETDPYNTRLRTGLPPTPIGQASLASLIAALRPVGSDYWYYLHDKDKNIRFAKTAAEHENNRKLYNVY